MSWSRVANAQGPLQSRCQCCAPGPVEYEYSSRCTLLVVGRMYLLYPGHPAIETGTVFTVGVQNPRNNPKSIAHLMLWTARWQATSGAWTLKWLTFDGTLWPEPRRTPFYLVRPCIYPTTQLHVRFVGQTVWDQFAFLSIVPSLMPTRRPSPA